ncbi:hypothetical protein AMS68_007181 [Peltaster fructicola]|uniref:alcohol O-acetyltransferase n=1 Tax=Peltaster fructicola TaxID=286661 RepID=A0A6H0Y3S8_9PEZI|nr:hypothetical protein AMS68_007181 [Peltaster fructicola]
MAYAWWPGSCSITYTHSQEPLILPTKDGPKRAFPELCKDTTPACNLNPLLFNGHLQTAWTAMKYDGPPVHYKRRVFESDDVKFKGHFAVDFVVSPPKPASNARDEEGNLKDDQGLKEDPTGVGHTDLPPRTTYFTDAEFEKLAAEDTKPLLIMLHGLSGGSYETYLRHVLEPLVASTTEGKQAGISGGDWEALVVNSRGCAGSKITTSMLYNARTTWDVRQVVKWCKKTWPNRPLFGIGFSLGANMLTNFIGEEGSSCLLNAACIVSNPWKLEVTHWALQRTTIGHRVYSKAMGSSMKALHDRHAEQLSQNKALNAERISKIKHLFEFDREVQCPTWGYPTETAYYRDASSDDAVLSIRIPVMALHSVDDPIAADEAVPYEEFRHSPWVVMVASSGGGHLGWFEIGGGRWHAKPIANWLNAMANVDFQHIEAPRMNHVGPRGGHELPFEFSALRRRAHIPGRDD